MNAQEKKQYLIKFFMTSHLNIQQLNYKIFHIHKSILSQFGQKKLKKHENFMRKSYKNCKIMEQDLKQKITTNKKEKKLMKKVQT